MQWLSFIFLVICCSCRPAESQKVKIANKYYDINGLIDRQVKSLDSIGLFLLKKAIIDGAEETAQFSQPNLSIWTRELAIFKSADINKSMLVDSYDIIETKNDVGKLIIYKSKNPESTQVDSLVISFIAQEKDPLAVYATITSKNALFESEKHLELDFNTEVGKTFLSNYRIKGWQKMISKDSTTFAIEGSIRQN